MLSLPRLGPITRSCTSSTAVAREPERSSSARSRASPVLKPVMTKLLLKTPLIVASLMTVSSVTSRVTGLPSTCAVSRRFSMRTTAM